MSALESSCTVYELRCNECGKSFGNRPLSACDDCLAPLEVKYDLDSVRGRFTRESVAAGPANIWRYKELLPIPVGFEPDLPVGFTPKRGCTGVPEASPRTTMRSPDVQLPVVSMSTTT